MRVQTKYATTAGGILASARVTADVSQRELAKRAGVAQSTIARIESGASDPGLETIAKILASVGLELRIHVETLDNHDRYLETYYSELDEATRARFDAEHQRQIEMFASGVLLKDDHGPRAPRGRDNSSL